MGPWEGPRVSWALMLVMWRAGFFRAWHWAGGAVSQKGTAGLSPLLSDIDVAELRLPQSPCFGPGCTGTH